MYPLGVEYRRVSGAEAHGSRCGRYPGGHARAHAPPLPQAYHAHYPAAGLL